MALNGRVVTDLKCNSTIRCLKYGPRTLDQGLELEARNQRKENKKVVHKTRDVNESPDNTGQLAESQGIKYWCVSRGPNRQIDAV